AGEQHRMQSIAAFGGNRMKGQKRYYVHGDTLDSVCAPEHICAAPLPKTPILAFEPKINLGLASIPEQETEFSRPDHNLSPYASSTSVGDGQAFNGDHSMSKEEDNKAVVGRWFTHFWGKTCDLAIVDEIAAPDMLLQYSLHAPRRGREDIK